MKITRKGKNRLEFTHIPIGAFIIGVAVSIIPMFFSVALSRTALLNCHRNEPGIAKAAKSGECKIKRKTWLPNSQEVEFYYLDEIYSASAPSSDDTSKLVIVLQNGEVVELSGVSTSDDKDGARDTINQFLKDPNIASVKVTDREGWSIMPAPIVLGIVSALIFSSVLVFSHISICHFDKTSGRMSLTIFGILGKSSIRYDLSQIVAVEVAINSTNNPLQVVVKAADPILLPFTIYITDSKKQKLADSINAFLGVA